MKLIESILQFQNYKMYTIKISCRKAVKKNIMNFSLYESLYMSRFVEDLKLTENRKTKVCWF